MSKRQEMRERQRRKQSRNRLWVIFVCNNRRLVDSIGSHFTQLTITKR